MVASTHSTKLIPQNYANMFCFYVKPYFMPSLSKGLTGGSTRITGHAFGILMAMLVPSSFGFRRQLTRAFCRAGEVKFVGLIDNNSNVLS